MRESKLDSGVIDGGSCAILIGYWCWGREMLIRKIIWETLERLVWLSIRVEGLDVVGVMAAVNALRNYHMIRSYHHHFY